MSIIGFIGLGNMGLPMAVNLKKAGHAIQAFDTVPSQLEIAKSEGMEICASAADAARGADIVITMLPNGEIVSAVYSQIIPAATKGALVIDSSTIDVSTAKSLHGQAGAAELLSLDAPVSGGAVGAEAGSLTIMASGSAEAFAIARPILDILGGNVYKLGNEPGLGSMMKTVNQLMCGAHIAVAAEATQLAAKAGIDPALAQEVLMSGAAASWMLGNRGPRMLQAEPPVTSAVDIFVKDLGLVLDAGKEARVGLPMAAAAMQMFLAASGQGLGRRDDSHVIRAYEVLNGVEITRKG